MYLDNNTITIQKCNSYNNNLIFLCLKVFLTTKGFDDSIAYK